jgi:Planctomycete cytochrome C
MNHTMDRARSLSLLPWLAVSVSSTAWASSLPPAAQVVGRLHIALLHFPLVLVIVAAAAVWLLPRTSVASVDADRVVQKLLWATAVAGVLAAVTGLMLADEEEFLGRSALTFQYHRAGGLAVAAISILAAALPAKWLRVRVPLLSVAALLVLIVGHWGGNLVHGDGYVLGPLNKKAIKTDDEGGRVASDAHEADGSEERGRWAEGTIVDKPDFKTHIAPVFERSCIKCHGATKRKGGLRLDEKRYAMKGGESGLVLVAGDPDKSLVFTMCALPPDDDDVMPERGKLLALSEIENIKRWVSQGAVWPE